MPKEKMIEFESHTLPNGLQVIVHPDKESNIAVLNLLYKVGSKNEHPDHTGFAHLFEHLMFGGSRNISSYDEALQRVGGENNAFTTPDITNYYLTLPPENLETGFWLESDRMLGLSFDPKVLEIQKKVVLEEFNQRYLNQPYGDVWHHLRSLAYHHHPYQWPTIGKDPSHIQETTMTMVKTFFSSYYVPNNAILVVAGKVNVDRVFSLVESWFGEILPGTNGQQVLPKEPMQREKRELHLVRDVPVRALYKVYHMVAKKDPSFYASDLLSDVLGRGKSSRLYLQLVEKQKIFTSLSSYTLGTSDPGLLVISGKIAPGISFEMAEKSVDKITHGFLDTKVSQRELEKVKNQAFATLRFGRVEILNRALSLAMGAAMQDIDLVNKEDQIIASVEAEELQAMAHSILRKNNCSTLYYESKKHL